MSTALQLLTDQDQEHELARALERETPPTPAEIDALVSGYLREMQTHAVDIARYQEARKLEHQRIDLCYDNFVRGPQAEYDRLDALVCAFAEKADFGKKKSRDVAYGAYGRRTEPARVKIVDPDKLLAWCHANAKTLITWKESVKHASIAEYFAQTGALPDGVEWTPESECAFARPEKS